MHSRCWRAILAGTAVLAFETSIAHAQRRPGTLWKPVAPVADTLDRSQARRFDALLEVEDRAQPVPSPARGSIRPYLLTGLVVGAVAGIVVVTQRARHRCQDCWFFPALEIPLFVVGGALVGYGVGGLVFMVTKRPGTSARP